MNCEITLADLDSEDFAALIIAHKQMMLGFSPADSAHALTLDDLRASDLTVWATHIGHRLVGCGALKALEPGHGEIKSMHTVEACRGQGLGRAMLFHIIAEARVRQYGRISLETGAMDGFANVRAFYEQHGFVYCEPIKGYRQDIHSVFMTLAL